MKTNNFKNSELQNRTAQHGKSRQAQKTNLHPIDFGKRQRNRQLPTQRVLELLRTETPRFSHLARVYGKWIWVRFNGKQPYQVTSALSTLGFHWNRRRQLWQHPCGVFTFRSYRTAGQEETR